MKKLFHKKGEPEERPSPAGAAGRALPLTHSAFAKVTAFILVLVSLAAVIGAAVYTALAADQALYVTPKEAFREEIFGSISEKYARAAGGALSENQRASAIAAVEHTNIVGFLVEDDFGRERFTWGESTKTAYRSEWFFVQEGESSYITAYADTGEVTALKEHIAVTVYLAEKLTVEDEFFLAQRLIDLAYALRYWIYAILLAALVLLVASFAFLMCASGRHMSSPHPEPGWGTRIPFDLLTCAVAAGIFLLVAAAIEGAYYFEPFLIALVATAYVAVVGMALGWCMSFAARVKLGAWWRNTVIFFALGLCLRSLRALWRGIKAVFRGLWGLLRSVPLAPKTVLVYVLIAFFEFVGIAVLYWDMERLLFVWFLEKGLLLALVLFLVLTLKKLQRGGAAIAAGDLSYQVDTAGMPADFRRHGEALNRIGEGMTAAVEQRMRSERMKTELITNVSHDIKTPLTSIINYADLIGKEPCENETITQYAAVLHRQSERLKRLIEDLVEASKASSGSLEVNLAPCEVGVLLTQAAGEYALRLQEKGLELVAEQPEAPVKILADGRRLWRVFDNLMNNVCKYAQRGTRVYLSLAVEGNMAVVTLKNTSRDPLNIPPEELMERFVRGDAARKSEGSGLGLSIARSLTELQKGTMELTVDGDLFKVILRFPVI